MKVTIYFIILTICLVLSAFFSAADMAYSSVNQLRLRKDVEKGRKSSSLAYSLSSQYDKTISTILFGNNLVNILASSIATLLGMELGGDLGMTIAPFIFLG